MPNVKNAFPGGHGPIHRETRAELVEFFFHFELGPRRCISRALHLSLQLGFPRTIFSGVRRENFRRGFFFQFPL